MESINMKALILKRVPFDSKGLYLFLFYAIFFTSSMDIFLNLRLGGFSFRFCYLNILLLTALNLGKLPAYLGQAKSFLGLAPLLGWTLFITAFVGNTSFLPRSIGYIAWHFIHLCFMLIVVNNFSTRASFESLLRGYLYSFVFLALFGLLQFFLGIAGISLLITQWWFPGMPRLNGFSYEPSFFGTYLMLGWILFFTLDTGKSALLPRWGFRMGNLIIALCLILSTSRMSILIMMIFMTAYSINIAAKAILTLKVKVSQAALIAGVVIFILGVVTLLTVYFDQLSFLINGIGIAGKSDQSTAYRYTTMVDTWRVFTNSPILGVSLGGVASAITEMNGVAATSNDVIKVYEGINIFVEVLAASGIFGFSFFLWFLFEIFQKPLRLAYRLRVTDSQISLLLRALLLALFVELLTLAMNQNILRPFLWIHIAMLALAYKIGSMTKEPLNELRTEEPRDSQNE